MLALLDLKHIKNLDIKVKKDYICYLFVFVSTSIYSDIDTLYYTLQSMIHQSIYSLMTIISLKRKQTSYNI